jgi:hypothetical protein
LALWPNEPTGILAYNELSENAKKYDNVTKKGKTLELAPPSEVIADKEPEVVEKVAERPKVKTDVILGSFVFKLAHKVKD